jgi:hypothetical protein
MGSSSAGRLAPSWPQPAIGVLTAVLALAALAVAWLRVGLGPNVAGDPGSVALGLLLAALIVVTYRYPIHVRLHSKVTLSSLPLVLLVALLPAPLAATAAGLGVLAAELSVRTARGNLACDIASEVGRRILLVLVAAVLAQAGAASPLHLALLGAALLLGLGDLVTYPLVMARDCPEPPHRVIQAAAQEAWAMEGIQILLGLAAALVARAELWALLGLVVPVVLVYRSFKRAAELQDSTRVLLERLADTVDLRDPYTGGHSRRVTAYCAQLLDALAVHGAEVELVLAAARVHDIGKIGVPDAILNKPGKLTDAERAEMERHPVLGADLLARQGDVGRGVAIVRHHHEAWDGSGYPAGLAGLDIPFGARVIAVADSYDAMTSDRPYRAGMPHAKAVAILRAGRGQQWDAALVDAFLRALERQEGLRPPAIAEPEGLPASA